MRHIVFLSILIGTSSSSHAGEISVRGYGSSYEWESSDCYKPSAPMVFDLDSFTEMQVETYLSSVERYRRCVRDEAKDDYEEAIRKLGDAIQEGIDDANSDVEADLRNLETSIILAQ